MTAKPSGLLVWIDMEMTGLDVERESILEIATLVTDGDLNVLAEGPELVVHQPDALLDAMDEWNRTHHGASGLTARSRASTVSLRDAEQETLAFVQRWCGKREAPLAGNSIHQDRRFIARYMGELDAWLHYRLVDVSTIKELARRWYPEALAGAPVKRETHRAMDDIRESVAELRYWRSTVFRTR